MGQFSVGGNTLIPDGVDLSADIENTFASTPRANSWTLYKGAKNQFFVMGIADGNLKLYLVTTPKKWKLTCEVSLSPGKLTEIPDSEVQVALKSISQLNNAVRGLTRDAGNCGTMHTAYRWRAQIEMHLQEALFRPWALVTPPSLSAYQIHSENSFGDYKRIYEQLKDWSLGGISEKRAFDVYNKQFEATVDDLVVFYKSKFRWTDQQSRKLAQSALSYSVSQGMGFYMYQPFADKSERNVRKAILEKRPMSEIRKFEIGAVLKDQLLDAAIGYPDALAYLLSNGADPNTTNGFGKTALMYAAQYNQIESSKLLLSRGADPNAATLWPSDDCAYTLSTSRMTPLHYAARYSSPELIALLIEHGALTFNKTDLKYQGPGEYPIDWLRKYSSVDSTEKNSNVTEESLPGLEQLLKLPSESERAVISADYTQRSEKAYSLSDYEKSYRLLMIALSANPLNKKALMNLPIIALNSGRVGESLEASDVVLAKFDEPSIQASAWFNKGLACERSMNKMIEYNGKMYCVFDPIEPFMQSWKLGHTEARKAKLKKVLEYVEPKACMIDDSGKFPTTYHFAYVREGMNEKMKIYVYHAPLANVNSESVSWSINQFDQKTNNSKLVTTHPKLVEEINLQQFGITVLQAENPPTKNEINIGGRICTPYL